MKSCWNLKANQKEIREWLGNMNPKIIKELLWVFLNESPIDIMQLKQEILNDVSNNINADGDNLLELKKQKELDEKRERNRKKILAKTQEQAHQFHYWGGKIGERY
jgi:hypothetical protein